MEYETLSGIAVIVDDEINDQTSEITQLIDSIEEAHIPCVKYLDLPESDVVTHLRSISFLVLDWDLVGESAAGAAMGDAFKKASEARLVAFIKRLRDEIFVPVFVFTNTELSEVRGVLEEADLIDDTSTSFVLLKSKSELLAGDLFEEIDGWIKSNPPVYTLAKWERKYAEARSNLFTDFYKLCTSWPSALWSTFNEDGTEPSQMLGDTITRNLQTRMSPFEFESKYLSDGSAIEMNDVRAVLEGERFLKKERLYDNSIASGDVFKDGRYYYINIRPDCDCIPGRGQENNSIDDVQIYLLRGSKITKTKETRLFEEDYGMLMEQSSEVIVFSMIDDATISFRLKDITISTWSEYKAKRIGRLLPPYVTRIQQSYGHYLQRQGLPRIPATALQPKEE